MRQFSDLQTNSLFFSVEHKDISPWQLMNSFHNCLSLEFKIVTVKETIAVIKAHSSVQCLFLTLFSP